MKTKIFFLSLILFSFLFASTSANAEQLYKYTGTRDGSNDLNYINGVLLTTNGTTPFHFQYNGSLSRRTGVSSFSEAPTANTDYTFFSNGQASPPDAKASIIDTGNKGPGNAPACPGYGNTSSYINIYVSNTNSLDMRVCSSYYSNMNAPTGYHWITSTDLGVPPASCTDGIQNQDETGIDIGGVCGTCDDGIQQTDVTNPEVAIDYGGRCFVASEERFNGCNTRDIVYYGTGAGTAYTMSGLASFGYTVTDNATESEWLSIFGLGGKTMEDLTWQSGDGLGFDIFSVYNLLLKSDEIDSPQVLSGSVSVASGGPISSISADYITGKPLTFSIYSTRSGSIRKFNYVKFTGVNYPTETKGSQTNYIGAVAFNTSNGVVSSPLVLSGGTAMAMLHDGLLANNAVITLEPQGITKGAYKFQFSGFSFGVLGTTLTVTECGNGDFKCKMYITDPLGFPECKADINSILGIGDKCVYSTDFTVPVVVNDAGDITTVSGNACIPNRKQGTIVTPDGFEVDYVVDGSGNVVQTNTRPIDKGEFSEQCLTADPGILEYVKCTFQFIGNKLSLLGTTTTESTKVLNNAQSAIKPNDTLSGSIELGQSDKQNTSNGLVNAVQNQYVAFDEGTDSFANVGTMMKWVLAAILTVVTILLFFALSRNRQK